MMSERTADSLEERVSAWPRVSLVIPTWNEARNLPFVLPHIPAWVYEVIIVDGRSTDDTIQVAQQLLPEVKVAYQTGKGKGDALRCGFEAATGDIIVMLDADGSTNPAEVPDFVGALLDGADYAKGSRFRKGGGTTDMSLLRQAGNLVFVSLIRLFFGGRYTDLCYGYNAFWRRSLAAIMPDCDGFEVETLMNIRALKHGLVIREVPSFESRRIFGEAHLRTFRDGWRVLRTIVREAREGWTSRRPEIAGVERVAEVLVWERPSSEEAVSSNASEVLSR